MDVYQKISIIVLGETGSGKSLFCKNFSKSTDFVSKESEESVTLDIIKKTFRVDSQKVEIELLDTPGTNDSRGIKQDKINLEATKKYLLEQKQRINCIIIVMKSSISRLSDSYKTAIKNICGIFPLPDFWEHVIIFWTNWAFRSKVEEKKKKQFIETKIVNGFKDLSIEIQKNNETKNINPITKDLHMIFNEFSEIETDLQILKTNNENQSKNFHKIVELAKKMKPIYEDILPSKTEIVLKDPKEGKTVGKNKQFKYEKILIRNYKDFGKTEIVQNKEIIGTFFVTEIETDWEKCPQESNEQQKKYVYKIYKKRIFTDENSKEFEPGNDLKDIKKIEILNEKIVEERTDTRPVDGNPNRKKIFKYDNVKYKNNNNWQKENEEVIEEIEEGETEWEKDPNFNKPNIERNIKYKTITKYDGKGNKKDGPQILKNNIVDWEEIETKKEEVTTIINDKTTLKKDKKITIKRSKKDPQGKEIKVEYDKEDNIEEYKEEYEPKENLDEFHIGQIDYNCYKVKYINEIKCDNEPKKPFPENNYIQYFKKGEEQKKTYEERNGKQFEILYNEIYMEDSRFPNKKNPTEFKYPIKENEINIKTKTEFREEYIKDGFIYKQCYRMFYKIGPDGKDIFDREEKEGKIQEVKIEYSNEYFDIEKPMTIEKIDELRKEKKYPITYKRIYYKKELNTEEQKEIPTGTIENVELKLEKEIKNDEKKENIQLVELTYINGVEKDRLVLNQSNKNFVIKEDPETTIEEDKIKIQKYKIYCYYDEKGNEKVHHKEKDGKPEYKTIDYGDEFYEEEDKKNNGKDGNKYPITFKRVYYKQEKNTGRDKKIKTGKVENVEIKLEHKTNISDSKNDKKIKIIEEYDVEVTYVNNIKTHTNEDNKINYTSKTDNNILKEFKFTKTREKGIVAKRWFSADEHLVEKIEVTRIIYKDGSIDEIENSLGTQIEKYDKK